MAHDEAKYKPLQRVSEDNLSDHELQSTQNHRARASRRHTAPIHVALGVSVAINVLLIALYQTIRSQAYLCVSEYTGLGLTIEKAYWPKTDYTHKNRSISDALWDSIDTSPNTIALSKEYTQQHGLGSSIPFPWEQSKGLYLIKGFHHMHCLKNIRKAYLDALTSQPSQPQLIPSNHVLHCLDTLRQDIMCRPDDTPMPSIQERHKWGDGQVRKCKDWDALVKWTQHPDRHACFRMLSDYRRVPHSLEQFAYCLEGSPYTGVMEEYFRVHGHRDPYALDDVKEEKHGGDGY